MRTTATLILLMLIVAACGGGNETVERTDTSAEVTTSVSVTTPSTDDTALTTTTAVATTTGATSTTAQADPMLEAALAAAGEYTGTWTNTTFGSSGEASLAMSVTEAGDVTMEWDLGGFVFGLTDPESESQSLNVADLVGGRVMETELFGTIEVDVSADFTTLMMTAADVPAPGIQAFEATASWSEDGTITGTYLVEFEGGGEPAEGVFELARG